MKALVWAVCAILLIAMPSCKGKKKTSSAVEIDSTQMASSWLLTDSLLPRSVDLSQDISGYSLQELRILRSYPYAIHGYYFMEADLNAFFSANTDWYSDLTYNLWEDAEMGKGTFAECYEDVRLTDEERAFVEKIDRRIGQLREGRYIKRESYNLYNPQNIVNLFQFRQIDAKLMQKLACQNFAIMPSKVEQLFHVYEENDYRQLPNFITTDLYLQAFHMYFSYVLKSLEKERFAPALEQMCLSLCQRANQVANSPGVDAKTKSAAEYAETFFAIPYYILSGEQISIPQDYAEMYKEELQHIQKCEDDNSAFLGYTSARFPYSLFRPRGHYTRSKEKQQYFQAMMWLQTASFCREDKEQLSRAVFMSALMNSTPANTEENAIAEKYDAVSQPLTFLTGEPDNLAFTDIIGILQKNKITTPEEALSAEVLQKISSELGTIAKRKNRIKPKIEVTCSDKINFMPQRYLFDNEVMQNLVDVEPNAKRAYPKGLDVFATMGWETAENLLTATYQEPKNWKDYASELKKLKDEYKQRNHTATVYDTWLKNLTELSHVDKGSPCFMHTPEWNLKCLNTGLASWAELKHDAILYGEQPMAAECGGGGPPDPIVLGYVEPNITFWNSMMALIDKTEEVLKTYGCLTEDIKGKTENLRENVEFLQHVVRKELGGLQLSEQEYRTIKYMGSTMEYFTLSVLDPDLSLDSWSLVQGADNSIAVVADVYTRNVLGCEKNGILHVATGNAGSIYVVVEIEGNLYLTRGATLMYYEFVKPLENRLTDEEWQQTLEDGKAPAMQEWMAPLLLDTEPAVSNRICYSSGC